eukprot:11740-Alexandrium_andersonii.AAC.1
MQERRPRQPLRADGRRPPAVPPSQLRADGRRPPAVSLSRLWAGARWGQSWVDPAHGQGREQEYSVDLRAWSRSCSALDL